MAFRPVQIARRLRSTQTSAEEMLWNQLRDRRFLGLKFRRQHPIAGFVADFCCIDLGLTIELDGVHHERQLALDEARRSQIERHGFLEIRFTNADVGERLDWVMREIARAVDIARGDKPRPSLPRWDPKAK